MLMGGAKRITLVEQMKIIAGEHLHLSFCSVEKDESFYPISSLARVFRAPVFNTPAFSDFLLERIKVGNLLPVACMDAAVPSIAALRNRQVGAAKVISCTVDGANVALNKAKMAEFCAQHAIPHPTAYHSKAEISGRVIAKPLEGFGGKGIHIIERFKAADEDLFATHIIQDFVPGPETTHDLYVDQAGGVISCSRDRLAVIDGEVDHCIVRATRPDEMEIFRKVANSGLFQGPLTVQTIRAEAGPVLIEINARLGGGVTASIAAGFPVLETLFYEAFGAVIAHRVFRPLEMKRARRDFYRFLNAD